MNQVIVYSPPEYPVLSGHYRKSMFLGGSIEMGKARNWQNEFIELTKKESYNWGIDILNPRRSNWDNTWKQSVEDGNFFQQVEWELSYLEKADIKVFVFCADTTSPISLLEFGRFSKEKPESIRLLVEPEYGRKGNLDVYCYKYGIKQYKTMAELVKAAVH